MKPRCRSLWILPAASTAVVPFFTVTRGLRSCRRPVRKEIQTEGLVAGVDESVAPHFRQA